jgi:hypothetical protein
MLFSEKENPVSYFPKSPSAPAIIQSIGGIPKVEMTIPRVTRDLLILAPSAIRSLQ